MLAIIKQNKVIFITVLIFLFFVLLISDPISQNPAYHLLADNRNWFSTANFANVYSNLPFGIIGIVGIILASKNNSKARLSWVTFFTGLVFVAVGSCYYHLNPNNQTLVWDRLPMMISFMGLFVALLAENVPGFNEKQALPVAVLLGLSSVIYWSYTDDLRFYGFMQFAPLIAIPVILYLYKGYYTHRNYLLYGLLFYVLAKVFELADKFIFQLSGQLISGHTIKHLLAAMATYCIYLMLKNRRLSVL